MTRAEFYERLTTEVAHAITQVVAPLKRELAELKQHVAVRDAQALKGWRVGASYGVDDVIQFDGRTFRARIAHVARGPKTDVAFWEQIT